MEFELQPTGTPVDAEARAKVLAAPAFGRVFTDHMVSVRWTRDAGWYDGRLVPYGPLSMDPANVVLHYAQEVFEGLKAYRQPDGGVAMFRPEKNAARMVRSCRRLALPVFPEDDFVAACELLVRTDKDWVPDGEGASLYLRPFMFADEVGLGVRPSDSAQFMVIASPAGNYFPGPLRPVSLWLSQEYTRAAPGGMGAAKTGGNYAASLVAQQEAADNGCDQVVFLDALEQRWIEELGGMNLFLVMDDGRLVTPALSGTILEGVTRDCVITLARELGHEVEERKVDVDEWRKGAVDGSVVEVFACGTAAVITPVGALRWPGGEAVAGDGEPGEVTTKLRNALLDIQYGRTEDTRGWVHRVV
ncbi:MAG: branched-chain amino acid aminotransferase [Actinobacteria bacterium]|nr:branched-chain amino acid aminotransferase [Actinomycetota bacterium]MCA1720133.1 branched-chain amino acid aminotransferase [Actinomycetota bacterium]